MEYGVMLNHQISVLQYLDGWERQQERQEKKRLVILSPKGSFWNKWKNEIKHRNWLTKFT